MQDVTVTTPGAQNAMCMVYIKGLRYRFYPPQTTKVPQADDDVIVDCLAPGNRRKKVTIDPDMSVYGFFNIANAGIGAAWDILSGAMFLYPRTIEIDFRDVPVRPMPLPTYNNPDIIQPEEHDLEEFLPGEPYLNSDKNKPVYKLRRRQVASEMPSGNDDVVVQGKGDLMSVIQDLRSEIDPVIQTSPVVVSPAVEDGKSDNAPLPLFPVE